MGNYTETPFAEDVPQMHTANTDSCAFILVKISFFHFTATYVPAGCSQAKARLPFSRESPQSYH